jgi:hypothetical protein
MKPDLKSLKRSNKLRLFLRDLEHFQELRRRIQSREFYKGLDEAQYSVPVCKAVRDPTHPLARQLTILPPGPEADKIIESVVISDIDGAFLDPSLFRHRLPVIIMQGPHQSRARLQELTKLYNYKVGWKEGRDSLGWAWVSDSVLVVSPSQEGYVFHCLALSAKNFPEILLASDKLEQAAPVMLESLEYVIGKSSSSIIKGKKRRGGLKTGQSPQLGQEVFGEMCMEGWVRSPLCLRPGQDFTFSFYRLRAGVSPHEIQEVCAPQVVAMNALEELYCPGAHAARWAETKHLGGIYPGLGRLGAGTGITATQGYACQWHLDSSTRGTFESILFGEPPDLPKGHRWVFGLIDAGVLLDLSKSAPLFLMLPGQDVLHGTLFTRKPSGRDHIEHESFGSALMNKQKLTTELGQTYPWYELVRSGLESTV